MLKAKVHAFIQQILNLRLMTLPLIHIRMQRSGLIGVCTHGELFAQNLLFPLGFLMSMGCVLVLRCVSTTLNCALIP